MPAQEITFNDATDAVPFGPHYFSIVDLRAFRPRDLSDPAKVTDARLEEARAIAEQAFERRCRVAFVPRSSTEDLVSRGGDALIVSRRMLRSVIALSVDGVALTAGELAALKLRQWGGIYRAAGWTAGAEISVTYEHGYDEPEAPVRNAVMILAAEGATTSNTPARATAQSIGDQLFRITIAGRDGRFGIPDVDAVADDYAYDGPAVG